MQGVMLDGEAGVKLLTADQIRCMVNNGGWNRTRRRQERPTDDFMPVVKLFCPWSPATWLLTEINPSDRDVAYGLCDVGIGLPEIGRVRLSSLRSMRSCHGVGIQRDRYFRPVMTLAGYAEKSQRYGQITA